MPRPPSLASVRPLLIRALAEDLGHGDLTTRALDLTGKAEARLIAQAPGVACGLPLLAPLFRLLDPRARVTLVSRDGRSVKPGQVLARVSASASALLAGERTALNLLMHLSGIATLSGRFVRAVRDTRAVVLDTRKTLPGLRHLGKYAVACGGASNHRMGLHDGILIKNNHLALLGGDAAGAVRKARGHGVRAEVEVEARTLTEALEAAGAGADIVLLDNFPPPALARAVREIRRRHPKRPLLEASGGITLATVRAYAKTGVDRISVGALTHSAPALPLALRLEAR